jgi:nucleotidyltransferase substrate binding protein (TIGR01987 family)
MTQDIRWIQRLQNFKKALAHLLKFIEKSELNELEASGMIQAYEVCYELAWNVLKDYFNYQGNSQITGARDAIREAFKYDLIEDGTQWMQMVTDRNLTTHTYDQELAAKIRLQIRNQYFGQFELLAQKMEIKSRDEA